MSPAVGAAAAPFNRLFEQTQAMVAGAQALDTGVTQFRLNNPDYVAAKGSKPDSPEFAATVQAVDAQFDQGLDVPGRVSLAPVLLAGAGPVRRASRGERAAQRLVHVAPAGQFHDGYIHDGS